MQSALTRPGRLIMMCHILCLGGLLMGTQADPAWAMDDTRDIAAGHGGWAVPLWFPKAVPLPPPAGEVILAASVNDLFAGIEKIGPGGTILLANGLYRLPRVIVLTGKKDITLRSASGDPARVILSGRGWDSEAEGDDILHIAHCEGVTIADMTFTDCRSYGIKVEAENAPRDIHIYNCRFRDIGVRAIKGSAGQDPNVRAVKGSVRFCQFENTRVPPAHWLFGGDYIAAIDMMALDNWTFSDNVFHNIKGRNGGARAAIFIWVRSRHVTVERNLMVNCDRGVAFGNPGQSTANIGSEALVYVSDGMIRNNFIAGGPDCGIELWHAQRIQVYHNTIWRPEQNWSRGMRIGTGTSDTDIVNNLVHGEMLFEGGRARVRHNLCARLDGCFTDPATGDLSLTATATCAIDRGVSLSEVFDDIRQQPRHGPVDLGAWEFNSVTPLPIPPGLDYMHSRIGSGPLSIHVLKIDRTLQQFTFTTSLAQNTIFGLEPLSQQVKAFDPTGPRPVAAINGDFFVIRPGPYQGDPLGLQIVEGELVSSPGRACFWLDQEQHPHIGQVRADFKAQWPDGMSIAFNINQALKKNHAVLYTAKRNKR